MNILVIEPRNFSEIDSNYPELKTLAQEDVTQYVRINPNTGKFGLTTKREDASTIEAVHAYMQNNLDKLEEHKVVLLQYVALTERVQPLSAQTNQSNKSVFSLFSKIIRPVKKSLGLQAEQQEEQVKKLQEEQLSNEVDMLDDLLTRVYGRLGKLKGLPHDS